VEIGIKPGQNLYLWISSDEDICEMMGASMKNLLDDFLVGLYSGWTNMFVGNDLPSVKYERSTAKTFYEGKEYPGEIQYTKATLKCGNLATLNAPHSYLDTFVPESVPRSDPQKLNISFIHKVICNAAVGITAVLPQVDCLISDEAGKFSAVQCVSTSEYSGGSGTTISDSPGNSPPLAPTVEKEGDLVTMTCPEQSLTYISIAAELMTVDESIARWICGELIGRNSAVSPIGEGSVPLARSPEVRRFDPEVKINAWRLQKLPLGQLLYEGGTLGSSSAKNIIDTPLDEKTSLQYVIDSGTLRFTRSGACEWVFTLREREHKIAAMLIVRLRLPRYLALLIQNVAGCSQSAEQVICGSPAVSSKSLKESEGIMDPEGENFCEERLRVLTNVLDEAWFLEEGFWVYLSIGGSVGDERLRLYGKPCRLAWETNPNTYIGKVMNLAQPDITYLDRENGANTKFVCVNGFAFVDINDSSHRFFPEGVHAIAIEKDGKSAIISSEDFLPPL
jgi:hypothetical protein